MALPEVMPGRYSAAMLVTSYVTPVLSLVEAQRMRYLNRRLETHQRLHQARDCILRSQDALREIRNRFEALPSLKSL